MKFTLIKTAFLVLVQIQMTGCKTFNSNGSALNSNGDLADAKQFPQALKLYNDERKSTCTAQLLDKNTILTAAHCVAGIREKMEIVYKDETKKEFSHNVYSLETYELKLDVFLNDAKVGTSGEIHVHPARTAAIKALLAKYMATDGKYGKGKFDGLETNFLNFEKEYLALEIANKANDLAFISLARSPEHANTEIPLAKLSPMPAVVGQAVLVVGYGAQEYKGQVDGKRRMGDNVIAKVDETYYSITAPTGSDDPMHTIAYQGDSGGLLYDKKTGEGLGIVTMVEINGVHTEDGTFKGNSTTYFVKLHTEVASSFICGKIPMICLDPKQNGKPIPKDPKIPVPEVPGKDKDAPPAKDPPPPPPPQVELPIEPVKNTPGQNQPTQKK